MRRTTCTCEAAQFIIEDNPEFMERALNIPKEIGERIRASWDRMS